MKLLKSVVVIGLVCGLTAPAWAALEAGCPQGSTLRKFGSVVTTDVAQALYGAGAEVRLIVLTCTATACVATLSDRADGDVVAADVVIEPGAAASATVILPQQGFFNPPLVFRSGIRYTGDGNVAAIGVYGCQF